MKTIKLENFGFIRNAGLDSNSFNKAYTVGNNDKIVITKYIGHGQAFINAFVKYYPRPFAKIDKPVAEVTNEDVQLLFKKCIAMQEHSSVKNKTNQELYDQAWGPKHDPSFPMAFPECNGEQYVEPEQVDAKRLVEMSLGIWSMMTDEEKVGYFCNTGIIGFVEDVAGIIGFDIDSISVDEFNDIVAQLDRPDSV